MFKLILFSLFLIGIQTSIAGECTPPILSLSTQKLIIPYLAIEAVSLLPNASKEYLKFSGDMVLSSIGSNRFIFSGSQFNMESISNESGCLPVYSSMTQTVIFPKIEVCSAVILPNEQTYDYCSGICFYTIMSKSPLMPDIFKIESVSEISCQ